MFTAVYPGTFDPITYGHRDVITRAARKICHRLIIGVANNPHKQLLFSDDERLLMIEADVVEMGLSASVEVRSFRGLLTNFVREIGADIVVRGLRAVSDFEYEFQMASANHKLDREVETVFLMASENHHFTASSVVREIAAFGGDIHHFVSPMVAEKMRQKLAINCETRPE
ncbi:MAG: pantetheine-phosphate adenylyltransferase [Alphaproteobacteria bacterium]|nr:pantetheine-phosphate adenylyltransferase [Alphaproteobacteria bacterium]